MSNEPPVAKSYIPTFDPAEEAAAAPRGQGTVAVLKWLNRIVATTLVVFIGAFAWSAVQSRLPAKGKRPRCGIDWLLWASGSKETFNSALQKKIAEGSHEFDKLNGNKSMITVNGADLSKYVSGPLKFEMPTFNPNLSMNRDQPPKPKGR